MKKKLLFTIILLSVVVMVSSTALMAAVSVTLQSDLPVRQQAESLAEYISRLEPVQQDEWFEELRTMALAQNMAFALQAENTEDSTVYVTDSGKRYHRGDDCSGLKSAKKISALTKEAAIEMGRTPCKICYPHGDSP